MAKLDFSGINKIALQGFKEQEERDTLIDQGFIIVPDDDNPFSGPERGRTAPLDEPATNPQPQSNSPSDGLKKPFMDTLGKRDYKAMYRVAHDFHEKHHPPVVALDYWKDHRPGEDDAPPAEADYWTQAAKDMVEISKAHDGDPFLIGLLHAVYEELEREYKQIIAQL